MKRGFTFCAGLVFAAALFEILGQADPRVVLSALAVSVVLLFLGA